MARTFLILLPAVLAVGATLVALRLELPGSETQRSRKLLTGALGVGAFLSIVSFFLTGTLDQSAHDDRIVQDTTKKVTATVSTEYEQKTAVLNAQILDLQRRLANRPEKVEVTQAGPAASQSPGATQVYWTQSALREGDAGELEVKFKTFAPLNIPAFVAICDQPCRAERAGAGAGSEGAELAGSTSKNIAGYVFKKPRPMPQDAEGFVILRGKPGFKVNEFRALEESEVPANFK